MAEISLCLSGGGYRAAMYHLGVLTYLNEVQCGDGTTLLDHVHTLTCISGGALPGLTYMMGEVRGDNRVAVFKKLFHDLVDHQLGEDLLRRFDIESQKGTGLIEVLADVYDDVFFKGDTFGAIMNSVRWDGIHHFAVDATDFELGAPFRFQATPPINDPEREYPYGIIGRWQHKIRRENAYHIRLADIMASTSCFPLVFEPILYPDNFKFPEGFAPAESGSMSYMLMDGGLVDNQGIDPALHADSHMKFHGLETDVIILSDAGGINNSEDTENPFAFDKTPDWISSFLKKVGYGSLTGALIISVIGIIFQFDLIPQFANPVINGIISMLLFLVAGVLLSVCIGCFIIRCLLGRANNWILGKIQKAVKFTVKNTFIWKSTITNIWTFVKSRVNTAYRMVDVVMMGNLRQKALGALYNSSKWDGHVVQNSLSILEGTKVMRSVKSIRDDSQIKDLVPQKRIRKNSLKAARMGTTLWFSKDEINNGMPKCLLACGQYTICWNLIVYIKKLKKRHSNGEIATLTDGQQYILALEPLLMGDWTRFQNNPYLKTSKYI